MPQPPQPQPVPSSRADAASWPDPLHTLPPRHRPRLRRPPAAHALPSLPCRVSPMPMPLPMPMPVPVPVRASASIDASHDASRNARSIACALPGLPTQCHQCRCLCRQCRCRCQYRCQPPVASPDASPEASAPLPAPCQSAHVTLTFLCHIPCVHAHDPMPVLSSLSLLSLSYPSPRPSRSVSASLLSTTSHV